MPQAKRIFDLASIFLLSLSMITSFYASSPLTYFTQSSEVVYAQTEPGSPPSDSFTITVVSGTSCPGPSPVPAGTTSADTIYGTDGNDVISGGNGNDVLFGCGGNDNINGGNGDDTIDGGPGDDDIFGGNQNDQLTGGPGADDFNCGAQTDTVTDYNPAEGDTITSDCENVTTATVPPDTTIDSATDGNSAPVINGGATTSNSITFVFSGTDDSSPIDHFICTLDGGSQINPCGTTVDSNTKTVTFTGLSISVHTFTVKAVTLESSQFVEDPSPATWSWTVQSSSTDCPGLGGDGTNGNDNLVGTNSADNINGGNGNDNIKGCGGDDDLSGNNDNDVIDGGAGDDDVFGNNGDDTLTGGSGADRFECGNGDDTITDYNPSEGDTIVDEQNCENITTVASIPSIDPPQTVTDCFNQFTITGTVDNGPDSVNLYIKEGEGETATLTLIGTAVDIGETGAWSINLDPTDENLGEGTFTLVAKAEIDGVESEESESVTLEIDCPLDQPTINQPDVITNCADGSTFTINGTADPDTDEVTVSIVDGNEIGSTTDIGEDGFWEITVNTNDIGEGTFQIIATATQGEGEGQETATSEEVTLEIDCPVPIPEITQSPEGTVTDCGDESTFDVSGTVDGLVDSINLYVKVGEGEAAILTLVGSTSDISETGAWTISVDPNDPALGDGTHTLVAKGVVGTEESEESESVTVTIDCPEPPTTIDDPADGTTIDCEEDLTLSGTFDGETFSSVEIFVDGESAGFANIEGNTWSFVIPANLLDEGDHTILAEATTGGSEPFTRASEPITVTAECPPDGGGGGGGGAGGGGGGAGGGGGGAGGAGSAGGATGSPVTSVERQIYQRPYTELACTESIVELKDDLIPTIADFPALVEEVKVQYNITVLNIYNAPDFKAMLLVDGDENKLDQDERFVLAPAVCGELILEVDLQNEINKALLDNTMTMSQLADQVVAEYKIVWVNTIDMPDYKALIVLADPTNPVTKDPRFIDYNESYENFSNHTGAGELDLSSGHIAAPPSEIKEQTVPDSIKRTFSMGELQNDSKSEDGKDIDVDIAILDTGVDLEHPDLDVYKDVNVIAPNQTGDDDNGHGTHVAGIAAAKDNGFGVVGGAPGARIWSVKVCSSDGECKISDMIKGVAYVTEHADEIDVANISVETPLSPALNRAISASIKEGVVYVVAAGNYGKDASTTSPASNPDAITVSAIADSDGKCGGKGPVPDLANSTDDTFAYFSNFGPSVSIAAPGVAVLSTYLNGEYAVDSGTSMASPSVAAVAALMKANSTSITPQEIKESILSAGSTPTTACEGGPQGYFSGDPDNINEPLLFRK